MTTVSRLGILAVIVLCAAVVSVPVEAQVLADEQGAAPPANPFTPPPCTTPVFNDVPCSNYFSAWIDQLYTDQVSTGCPYPNFCPDQYVTRGQMSAFLERAMRGTANWTPGDVGNYNTGIGWANLLANTSGNNNVAVGWKSLTANTVGYFNIAVGSMSLWKSSTSSDNTGVGFESLYSDTTGNANTAVGEGGLYTNTTGDGDTAVGFAADVAASNLSNAMALGYMASVDASNHVRIGNTSVTQIGGQVGWSNLSDIRAKTNIQPLDLGLDLVMALRPVSFTLKEGNGRTDLGFIAQDVETLLGDGYNVLGIGGDKDRTLSLRYTDFIAPMVKAIQEQQATITALQKDNEDLKARLAKLELAVLTLSTKTPPSAAAH